ncbi:hypothetical protein BECAL_02975 [Bellilinea caldifistulae]|nr:hypothetical protein [Bellilinea caldifistulae]GAP11782.1 hypothetical protein BECAL_02975 [Bellilinea caldifistulae]
MNTDIFINPIEKIMQLKIGALVLVIWKTYRWRVVFYAGHHRFVIL